MFAIGTSSMPPQYPLIKEYTLSHIRDPTIVIIDYKVSDCFPPGSCYRLDLLDPRHRNPAPHSPGTPLCCGTGKPELLKAKVFFSESSRYLGLRA